MHMRTGTSAGISRLGDRLSLVDFIALLDQQFTVMRVPGFLPVLMVDHDHVAVGAAVLRFNNGTAVCGIDCRSNAYSQVNTLMLSAPARSESGRPRKAVLKRPDVLAGSHRRRSFLRTYQYDLCDRFFLHGSYQIFFLHLLAVLQRNER